MSAMKFPGNEDPEEPDEVLGGVTNEGENASIAEPPSNPSSTVVSSESKQIKPHNETSLEEKALDGSDTAKEKEIASKQSKSKHEMVVVNIEEVALPLPLPEHTEGSSEPERNTSTIPGSNNNCMALVPINTGTGKLVPLALLGKPSANEECPGGLMQLITGKNRVAPAATVGGSEAATVGTVLMIIPKKSDSVCVDIPQDPENNFQGEKSQPEQGEANISSVGAAGSEHVVMKPTLSYDSYEDVCRICHDNPSKLELISPCLCKGSMSKVHRTCLERWLGESAKNSCEICGYEYNTVRKPKYTGCRSVYEWIRHPLAASDTRNLFFDIACFFILTPLAAVSSWLCVVGAQHYSFGDDQKRKIKYHDSNGRTTIRDASNATWTSVGLLSLTGTLLAAYYIWLFVAIRYHIQVWREWQQRNFIVNIVPFEDGCMGRPPQPRAVRPANTSANDAPDRNARGSYRSRNARRRSGENNNLPTIFSRSHFLQNMPPGYTISETALLYQAMYGSDSDTVFVNENILALAGDSSLEDIWDTNSSSATVLQPGPEANGEIEEQEISGPYNQVETIGQDEESLSHTNASIEMPSRIASSPCQNNNAPSPQQPVGIRASANNISAGCNSSRQEVSPSDKSQSLSHVSNQDTANHVLIATENDIYIGSDTIQNV